MKEYKNFKQIINSFYDDEINRDITNKNTKQELEYKNINIMPKLFYDKVYNKLNIEFKIGNTQYYKIKNILEFYNRFKKDEKFRYGNGLEFIHNKENFNKDSKKILDFIFKYAEIIEYVNDTGENNNRYYGKKVSESCISISPKVLDEIFEILKGRKIEIEKEGKISKVTLIPNEPNIEFYFNQNNEEEFSITTNIQKYNYILIEGKKYIYIILDEYIYRANKKIKNTTFKLLDIFKRNMKDEIEFGKKDLSNFFSIVEPKINKSLKFNIDKEKIKKYIPEKLGVKIFLDYDKNGYLIAEVKFCYGENEINPIQTDNNVTFARNAIKESEVLNLFMETGFMLDAQNKRFILTSDDDIYNFITNYINEYMQKFGILVTDNFKLKQIKQPKIGNIGIKIENNLLHINLENLDFDKEELNNILNQYVLKKKYYRLKDGSFLKLEENEDIEFLENLKNGLEINYNEIKNGSITLPIYRGMYLEKILNKLKNNPINKDEKYKNLVNNLSKDNSYNEINIPKNLNGKLRDYQKNGFMWLNTLEKYGLGGILADDMGLGKTIQVLTLLLKYKEENDINKPSIVVAPSSLTLNWKNEIEKFSPDINAIVINGNATERRKKINDIKKYDLAITSYDLLKRDIEIYQKKNYEFKYSIADEAQYIKNSNTQNAKALKNINAETKFALTGTPIENSLSELWSIFDYIMPDYLFGYKKFKQIYEYPIIKENDKKTMEKLKMLIEPFILRRNKKEVLTELPEKTITILNNEMEEEQKKLYLSYLKQARKEAEEEIDINGIEHSQIKILSLLTRLRQLCCHPSLFIENYKSDSSKLKQCIEILKEGIESGHKILLFSSYTSMFDLIEEELNKENIKYYKLTGKTKVDERIELVEDFNENKQIKVFLISLKAGGTGLNLTGADMIIHYDPWWNVSAENQATDRAYRIGQKNNVQVYKLITKNSIEEKIYELQNRKSKLIDSLLSTKNTFISKLSKEEIMKLFE